MAQLRLASSVISKRQRPVQSTGRPCKRAMGQSKPNPQCHGSTGSEAEVGDWGSPAAAPERPGWLDPALGPRILNQPLLNHPLRVFPSSYRPRFWGPQRVPELKATRSCCSGDQKFRTLTRRQEPAVLSSARGKGGLCGHERGCPQGEPRPGLLCFLRKA